MKAGDFYIFRDRKYSSLTERIDVIGVLKHTDTFEQYYCYFITPSPSRERSMSNPSAGNSYLTGGEFILPKEFLL